MNMNTKELMKNFAELFKNEVKDYCNVSFSDNLALASGCDNYGCTCIAYEKCCGCLIQ